MSRAALIFSKKISTASSQTGTADYIFYPFRYHLRRPFSAWNHFSGHLARICTYPFRLGWRGRNVREDPDTWPLGKSMSERPSIWYHRVTGICVSAWWESKSGLSDSILREWSLLLGKDTFFSLSNSGAGATFLSLEKII